MFLLKYFPLLLTPVPANISTKASPQNTNTIYSNYQRKAVTASSSAMYANTYSNVGTYRFTVCSNSSLTVVVF